MAVLQAHSREYYIKGVGSSSVAEIAGPDVETAAGYYTGHGEKPGRWLCAGAAELGLVGEVDPDQFLALFDGLDPHTGEPLRDDHEKRARKLRPGWDCTFSAVKSVSALWALAPAEVSAQIEAAHQAAVDAGVAYLEARASRVRRGKGGKRQYEAKMVAAGFSHRTSRAVDPQLHEHIVIFAQALGPDGRWTTLGSTELYDHFRTADSFYQAQLREELTRRLGVAWTAPDENGISEIAGVDERLLKLFSKRRAMIEAEIAEGGYDIDNPAHCQMATLETRQGKEGGKSTGELRSDWATEVAAAGFTGASVWQAVRNAEGGMSATVAAHVALVRAALGADGWTLDRVRRELAEHKVSIAGLEDAAAAVMESPACQLEDRLRYAFDWVTRNRSTFDRRDMIQALARLGVPAGELNAQAQALLQSGEAVLVRDFDEHTVGANGATVPTRAQGRWTTPAVLAAETRLLGLAPQACGFPGAPVADVQRVLDRYPTLGADQAGMVMHLLTNPARVLVVAAPPGSGKTFSLRAAREGAVAAGRQVVGCSTAANAAQLLEQETGIPSSTIDSLLLRLDAGTTALVPGTVVAVDEAGMVGTRKLDRLAAHVARVEGAQLWLVGDGKQLQSVEAGGLFDEIQHRHPELVAELDTNRRQKMAWERVATGRLRAATSVDAAEIVATYARHGRLIAAPDRDAVFERMAGDYWDARATVIGTGDEQRQAIALLLASRRADVAGLNAAAMAEAVRRGILDPDRSVEFAGRTWLVGQLALAAKNDAHAGVLNGHQGVVVGVHERPSAWQKTVTTDGGRVLTVRSTTENAVGDEFEMKVGSRREKVRVTAIEPVEWRDCLGIRREDGETVWLPEGYAREHLTDGYALTVHKAQGQTVDAALTYGVGTTRETLYVALTRARGIGEAESAEGAGAAAEETPQQRAAATRHRRAEADASVVNNRIYVVGDDAALHLDEDELRPAAALTPAEGGVLVHDKLTVGAAAEAVIDTMARDLWDRLDSRSPQLRAAELDATVAEERLQRLLDDPAADLDDEAAAMADADQAQREVERLRAAGPGRVTPAVMVAQRRAEVAQLNAAAVAEGVRRGEVSPDVVTAAGRGWHPGQRAVVLARGRRGLERGELVTVAGTANVPTKWTATVEFADGRYRTVTGRTERAVGDQVEVRGRVGTVTAVEASGHEDRLIVQRADGSTLSLQDSFVERSVTDGYAVTVAALPGVKERVGEPVEQLLLTTALPAQHAGTLVEDAAQVYEVGAPAGPQLSEQAREHERMLAELAAQVGRSGAERAASTEWRDKTITVERVRVLSDEYQLLADTLAQCPPTASAERTRVRRALAASRTRLRELLGQSWQGAEEAAERAAVEVAEREAELAALEPREDGSPTPVDAARAAWLVEHAASVRRADEVRDRLTTAAHLTVVAAERGGELPSYLPPVPAGQVELAAWRGSCAAVEAYRLRWGVTDDGHALGVRPTHPVQHREWLELHVEPPVDEQRGRDDVSAEHAAGRGREMDRSVGVGVGV